MSIKKHYLKNHDMCRITFSLKEKVKSIDNVRIAGDFNNWDQHCQPMKVLKKGGLTQSISLPSGKSYQFKYLINDSVWANDPESDEFVPNGLGPGQYNSLIVV
ncbi:MAG: isoamylase early set domain-containing protein [Bacteroidales bacterium]